MNKLILAPKARQRFGARRACRTFAFANDSR